MANAGAELSVPVPLDRNTIPCSNESALVIPYDLCPIWGFATGHPFHYFRPQLASGAFSHPGRHFLDCAGRDVRNTFRFTHVLVPACLSANGYRGCGTSQVATSLLLHLPILPCWS